MISILKKNHLVVKFTLLIILIFLVGFFGLWLKEVLIFPPKSSPQSSQNDLGKDLELSMALYANWLIKNQTPNGDFIYQRQVINGKISPDYNIVRQASSLYALSLYYKRTHDPKTRDALKKGINFFQNNSVAHNVVIDGVTYPAEVVIYNNIRINNTTAFILLTLIHLIETDTENRENNIDYARKLANYLVSTQLSGGGFRYRDNPNIEDSYNDGETLYALIKMANLDNNRLYLDSSKKAADYFMKKYQDQFTSSFFCWGMQGFYYLYPLDNDKYWAFMKNYAEQYMKADGEMSEKFFAQNGATAPGLGIAVQMEGLNHIAKIAGEKDPKYSKRLQKLIEESLVYVMQFQIDGPRSTRVSTIERIKGGNCFDYYCRIQRIDSTGHALSAIYHYLTFF